jgi:hypothetical protein
MLVPVTGPAGATLSKVFVNGVPLFQTPVLPSGSSARTRQ